MGHCPYLGLKQNRAIRFASPTPEHRCYISGDPLEIPVDQASHCLSSNHVRCPLYTGLIPPTTNAGVVAPAVIAAPQAAAPSGLRGWFRSLAPRDQAVYALMLAILAGIIGIYLFLGVQTLLGLGEGAAPTPGLSQASSRGAARGDEGAAPTTAAPATAAPTANPPTAVPPTPTDLPTRVPTARPTERPTTAPIILPPTALPTQPPTAPPATAAPTAAPTQPPATAAPTQPTRAPPPPARPRPTVTPVPTEPPAVVVPPVPSPEPGPPPPPPESGNPPEGNVSSQIVTLYFADGTGTLFVPVQRRIRVVNNQVATAAVRELIAGPRRGPQPLLLPDVRLLGVTPDGATARVNFDRWPTGQGDTRGFYATTLTLTEFPSIRRVAFAINGQPVRVDGADALTRPIVNPLNPQGLPADYSATEFLPLYFPAINGGYDVRVIRMTPKTKQTAEATVRALLDGPGDYSYALRRAVPPGTELRGIRLENGIAIVDFTQPFADAPDRDAAVRTVVESLTTLKTVRGVIFLVEGRSLAEQWGGAYGGVFARRLVNEE